MTEELIVHGIEWTVKELFVYPNEYIYWSIQIVMYPYMTGLVAGAFVLSSLYHVFGQKELKGNRAVFAGVLAGLAAGCRIAAAPASYSNQCGPWSRC